MATKEESSSNNKKFDWNAKARLIYLQREREEEYFKNSDLEYMKWEGRDFGTHGDEVEIPEERQVLPNDEDLQQFIETNSKGLHHGDLLTTKSAERAINMLIVVFDEEENKYKAIKNPDEGGSGYLTIPMEVLKNVTNAMDKYEEIFNSMDVEPINIHISAKDDFIVERLGKDVNENWQFDLHIIGGEVEEAYVRLNELDEWQDFDVEDSSAELIDELFDQGEKVTFKVSVELKDEKFEAYKKKYGKERVKYGWMHEKPILPSKWVAEKGASSGGSDYMKWEWIFKGPSNSQSAAKESVETFLNDFSYKYQEEKE